MDKLIISAGGLFIIGFIYWFFFGKKDEALEVQASFSINVQGGYKPKLIRIKQGKPVTLTFFRKDTNSCLEEVVFPDYKIKEYLPLNKEVTITLSPPHPKKSSWHCNMNMFQGKIITEE